MKKKHHHRPIGGKLISDSRPFHGKTRAGYTHSFDGLDLYYCAEGDGPPLVFCYGMVCSSLHWTYQIQRFRHDYEAIWFDYRGHQNSEVPSDVSTITIENMARDLRSVLDHLEIEEAVLLGHSMGVSVALEFCHQHPERVAGMVLSNGTLNRPFDHMYGSSFPTDGFKILRSIYNALPLPVELIWHSGKTSEWFNWLIASGGFNPHVAAEEDVRMYIEKAAAFGPKLFFQIAKSYDEWDGSPWLSTLTTPTLLIGGEQDQMTPPVHQKLMHQLLPNSRLKIIPRGSHCVPMDFPERVDKEIEGFLKELGWSHRELLARGQ